MKRILFLIVSFFLVKASCFSAEPVRIDIEGPINSVLADYVVQAMDQAEVEKAPFVILRLNTPGGFDLAMRKIIEKVLTSSIPIIAYVAPSGARAASAGFFILLASDLACMAPGTNTGAAHPVLSIGGVFPVASESGGMKTLTEKSENDAKAYLKSIVEKRKRNMELAEKGISESKSFTAEEALKTQLIDLIAKDENELLKMLQGRKIHRFNDNEVVLPEKLETIKVYVLTLRQKVLLAISDATFALLLGLAGLLLLYFEFAHPGLIMPGVIGALSLILSFIGFSFLPINFVGALLMILAIGLFIAEIKVQGFGVLGIGGFIAMFIGILILIDTPDPALRITLPIALSVVIPFGLILMFLVRLAFRSMSQKIQTGNEAMIGLEGIAYTELEPEGKVHVRGEYWDATSKLEVAKGRKVRVIEVRDLKLIVEEVKED